MTGFILPVSFRLLLTFLSYLTAKNAKITQSTVVSLHDVEDRTKKYPSFEFRGTRTVF